MLRRITTLRTCTLNRTLLVPVACAQSQARRTYVSNITRNNDFKCELKDRKCVACHGGIPSLQGEVLDNFLKKLDWAWKLNDLGHLERSFIFEDFLQAMSLANSIAELAEQEGHHPDLQISWGKCVVEIWTHKINGLSESDFILAAKIDALPLSESFIDYPEPIG